MQKKRIITTLSIFFLVMSILGCTAAAGVEEMNRQYFISVYGFDTATGTTTTPNSGSFSTSSIGPAGVEEMNQNYFESTYGFQIGKTSWSNFGAGTDWSHFGASVTSVEAANNISMKETGLPLVGIALAILLVTAGVILPKRK